MPKSPSDFAKAAQEEQTCKAVVEGPDGHEYDLFVADFKPAHLETLEQREKDGDLTERESMQELVDEYLEEPDLDVDEVGQAWLNAAFIGVMKAWDADDEFIKEKMEQVELAGNLE